MTTPTVPPISLSHVLTELRTTNPGRALPISLGDADVRALAGVPTGPISLTNLLGKSAYVPPAPTLSATGNNDYQYFDVTGGPGTLSCSPSVTVSNAAGPLSFTWTFLSNPRGMVLNNAGSQTCDVTIDYAKFSSGSATAYLRCVVSDTSTSVTIDNIIAQIQWNNTV